jgi:hypothetical protein
MVALPGFRQGSCKAQGYAKPRNDGGEHRGDGSADSLANGGLVSLIRLGEIEQRQPMPIQWRPRRSAS